MTPISFFIPPNAELEIVDVVDGIPTDSVGTFRARCLSDGKVSCSWEVIEEKLHDRTVLGVWWELTREERYSIAETAANNVLCYKVEKYRHGKPKCEGGEGDWLTAVCVQNAMIRQLRFGEHVNVGGDSCYYKNNNNDEVCYLPEKTLNLPCFMVTCVTKDAGFGHSMTAIQIGEDESDLNSFVIFHCSTFDIPLGGSQLPVYSWPAIHVSIGRITFAVCAGYSKDATGEWWFYN